MCANRTPWVARAFVVLVLCLYAQPLGAITRRVPTEFSTIQGAVNASGTGDTVLVFPGTYRENILILKDVWLRSVGGPAVTVIDGSSPSSPDTASVVAIISPEPRITGGGIEGFDIRNGRGTRLVDGRHGGGIFFKDTGAPGPLVRNNWIHDNLVTHPTQADGGGLSATSFWVGEVRVTSNRFYNNAIQSDTRTFGTAVSISTSSSRLEANEIFNNHNSSQRGFGAVWAGEAAVVGNVIACNVGDYDSALGAYGLVEGNTIVANWSNLGGGVVRVSGGDDHVAIVRGNNITYNFGPGLECYQRVYPPFSSFIVECNNIAFNGPGGQIIGACSDAIGQDGNISVDPEYGRGMGCPSSPGDWCLGPTSPLLAQNSPPGCGLIGAWGVCPPVAVPESDARRAGGLQALPARPNPFFERTTITFYLPQPSEVEISIYGVLGRKVRTLTAVALSAGENELEWDGRGDDGEPAASGAYVAVIRAGGREVTRTLLLIR